MSIVFLLLVVVSVFAIAHHDKRRTDQAWQKLSEFLGLELRGSRHLAGAIEGHDVVVDTVTRGSGKSRQTFFRVVVKAPVAAWRLAIKSEGGWTNLQKWLGSDDVRVRDDAFDKAMHVRGDELDAIALLGADVRLKLLAFVNGLGGVLESGEFRWEVPASASNVWSITGAVEAAVALAKSVDVEPTKPAERLSKNAITDPEPAVRQRNFELLVKHFPREATPAAEALRSDTSTSLRLVVAKHLADDRAFEELAGLVSTASEPAVRSAALEFLVATFSYERVAPILKEVLEAGVREPVLPALRAIGAHGDLSLREAVEAFARTDDDPELAAQAATTLGQLGAGASEGTLLALLLASTSGEVLEAAATALGRLASVRAVEPLLPLAQGFSLDGALKSAAQDAIRQIQARAGPVDGGRLSLASTPEHEGALSLASDGGGLSLAEPADDASRSPAKVRG